MPGAMAKFTIGRTAEFQLRADLTNLDEMPIGALRTALKGPSAGAIYDKLLEGMLAAAKGDPGVPTTALPPMLRQGASECVPYAFLNGMRGVGAAALSDALRPLVPNLKSAAREFFRVTTDEQNLGVMYALFNSIGCVTSVAAVNPIKVARRLFQPNAFFVSLVSGTAECFIAHRPATEQDFVVGIHSARPSVYVVQASKFLMTAISSDTSNAMVCIANPQSADGVAERLDAFLTEKRDWAGLKALWDQR